MQNQIELRREVDQIERRGRGRRFPEPLRTRLISYIRLRREAGRTFKTIGNEIGISLKTISRWLSDEENEAGFRCVEVAHERRRRAMVVHGPHGVWVEGMAVEDLAELLRRLG